MEKLQFINIVTASAGDVNALNRVYRCLKRQTRRDFTWIIVNNDVNMSNVSLFVDKIKRNKLFQVQSIIEADNGLADAWNKGLRVCSHDSLVILLNSDDFIPRFYVENVIKGISVNTVDCIYYGDTIFFSDEYRFRRYKKAKKYIWFPVWAGFSFVHTSCVIAKSVYDMVGDFDGNIKVAVDSDWLFRARQLGIKMNHHGAINYMAIGGMSDKNNDLGVREFRDSVERYSSSSHIYRVVFEVVEKFTKNSKMGVVVMRTQAVFAYIGLINFLLYFVPFSILRRYILKFANFNVHRTASILPGIKIKGLKRVSIGKNSVICRNVLFDNRAEISIGNDCMVGEEVLLLTAGHRTDDPEFSYRARKITIGDGVVVFRNAGIMPGCTIDNFAVVLPMSVVTKDIQKNIVVGGNPAVKKKQECIKKRNIKSYKYLWPI